MIVLVANKEATQINLSKAISGVKMKGIVESSTIPLRHEIRKELEVPLRLNAPEVREKLNENFLIRKYSNLPLQLGTMDSSIAGIQFMNPQNRGLSPYFISTKKEFIEWVEKIFYYYWEHSEPVEIY